MTLGQLAGTRIRERRIQQGVRQSDLAQRAGISASYLNLIEHNKRRIGGKILNSIAAALEVEPSQLSEGAEAAMVAGLQEAWAAHASSGTKPESPQDLAGRFPGWAEVLMRCHTRIDALERTVETLTDRLAHDPHLATALHEVISTVTAIRSTAGILVDTKEIEPEWRDRFQRNINEEAARLAQSAQGLVAYLDSAGESQSAMSVPEEELDAFLAEREWSFAELEGGHESVADILATAEKLQSSAAHHQAEIWLTRYQKDAAQLPMSDLIEWCERNPLDPGVLARAFDVSIDVAMRRLASLPKDTNAGPIGLVSCDSSGALIFRKPIDGFAVPRFGTACPLWPLFSALNHPQIPLKVVLQQPGRDGGRFMAFAIAQPMVAVDFASSPVFIAHMLIVPDTARASNVSGAAVKEVGAACRICPRQSCPARREQSILTDGF